MMLPLVLEGYLVDAAPGTGELPCRCCPWYWRANLLVLSLVLQSYLVDTDPGPGELPC
jgi:hypothetical protein